MMVCADPFELHNHFQSYCEEEQSLYNLLYCKSPSSSYIAKHFNKTNRCNNCETAPEIKGLSISFDFVNEGIGCINYSTSIFLGRLMI